MTNDGYIEPDCIDKMLGIDPNDPVQQYAGELVDEAFAMYDRFHKVREKHGITREQLVGELGDYVIEQIDDRQPTIQDLQVYRLCLFRLTGEKV